MTGIRHNVGPYEVVFYHLPVNVFPNPAGLFM